MRFKSDRYSLRSNCAAIETRLADFTELAMEMRRSELLSLTGSDLYLGVSSRFTSVEFKAGVGERLVNRLSG